MKSLFSLLFRHCVSELAISVKGVEGLTARLAFVLFPVEYSEFEFFASGLGGVFTAYWTLHFNLPVTNFSDVYLNFSLLKKNAQKNKLMFCLKKPRNQ